jgi:hypothetical protein
MRRFHRASSPTAPHLLSLQTVSTGHLEAASRPGTIQSMSDEALRQVIADYYRDFSTLNVLGILPYFHEPCLLIGPPGVIPIPDHAALADVFGPVMEGLRAQGYGHSELELGYIRPLSSSVALIGGVAVRYTTDGRQLDRVGVTYVLHKTGSGWKFATVILHDPETAVVPS